MPSEILICAVGGQDVEPYIYFFHTFSTIREYSFRVNVKKGYSKERCVETYSIHMGGGYGDITEGNADVVISLEQLEGVRFRHYVKENGGMVVSAKRILPVSVVTNVAKYPEQPLQQCLNDCFLVYKFEEQDSVAFACMLAMKILGCDKTTLYEFAKLGNLFTPEEVDRVFSEKPIRA